MTTPLDPEPILDADFAGGCREAGFERTQVIPLRGPASAALACE